MKKNTFIMLRLLVWTFSKIYVMPILLFRYFEYELIQLKRNVDLIKAEFSVLLSFLKHTHTDTHTEVSFGKIPEK